MSKATLTAHGRMIAATGSNNQVVIEAGTNNPRKRWRSLPWPWDNMIKRSDGSKEHRVVDPCYVNILNNSAGHARAEDGFSGALVLKTETLGHEPVMNAGQDQPKHKSEGKVGYACTRAQTYGVALLQWDGRASPTAIRHRARH